MSTTPPALAPNRPVPIAPAPNGRPTPQSENEQTMSYTCLTCSKRKVRCDKTAPACFTCRKARLECIYQEPAPRKRKRKTVDDVHERLENYEKLLKQNGIISQDESQQTSPVDSAPAQTPYLSIQGVSKNPSFKGVGDGRLLGRPGKARYIDSNVWKNLGEEVLNASSDEEEEEEELNAQRVGLYQPSLTTDPVSAGLLGPSSPPASLIDLHPTYEAAMKLWKIYVENIDPMVKVFHVPSARDIVQRGAANPSSASKSTEVLLFAVYHFALITLTDAECQKMFGEARAKLISRYYDALRQALVNAYFLRTTDLMVIQAYILFLLSVRTTCDPHTFWMLTGVAVRLSQRIGLHRDGESLGLKPYDVQVRRRVFWQLLPLDGLAGQRCGTGICITADSWDVKQPLNINDADIWPGMTEPPEPRTGATDMIFCLARTEIGKFVQKSNPPMGNWARMWDGDKDNISEVEKALTEVEELMEMKYLRYCDLANPLHIMTMGMVRGSVCSGRLRMRLSRAKHVKVLPEPQRQEIWNLCHRMIDYDIAAHSNNMLLKYMWHMKAFFQWDPLIWILNDMRRNPQSHEYEPSWSKIEQVYANHPEMIIRKPALHVATSRLVLKTWDLWTATRPQEEVAIRGDPSFILTIRARAERRDSQANKATPVQPYNPFAFGDEAFGDLPLPQLPQGGGPDFNFDYSQIDFNNADSMDWMFWDQLIRDPTSFPTS